MLESSLSTSIRCIYCGSRNIVEKEAVSTMHRGDIPRYLCKSCGRSFRWGPFTRDKYGVDVVKRTLELAVENFKYRKIATKLGISKATVAKIIRKYAKYLQLYMEKCVRLKLGSIWELDDLWYTLADNYSLIRLPKTELPGLVENRRIYLTNIIDRSTRFWIAAAPEFDNDEAVTVALTRAMRMVKNPKKRIYLLSDASTVYPRLVQLFPTFNHVPVSKDENRGIVNKVERLHLTIRDVLPRQRRFRSLESVKAIIILFRFYYNFVRPHTGRGLDGKTPAEKAGCNPLKEDKWFMAITIGYQKLLESRWMDKKALDKIHRKRFQKTTAKSSEKTQDAYLHNRVSNSERSSLEYYIHKKRPFDMPVSDVCGEFT